MRRVSQQVRPASVRAFLALALVVVTLAGLFVTERLTAVGAPTFTPGDLALLVAGASAANTTGSIVEISATTASQTPATAVQTIALPDTLSPDSYRISGSATSTGYVSLSNDRTLLTFTGANSTTLLPTNVNTLNPRGVYTVSNAGTVTKQTTYTGTSGNQTRSATSLDNTTWYIGDQGGFYSNGTSTASPSGNVRGVKSFGGTVYAFTASATAPPVGIISAPAGGTYTGLPGLANGNAQMQDFYLIQSGSNGSTYDVLYVLNATAAAAGTISKYSLVDTNGNSVLGDAGDLWTANGSYATNFGGFGLAAADAGVGAVLYISTGTGATTANSVVKVADDAGYNAAMSVTTAVVTLYTAGAGTIIKGLDFAPKAPSVAVNLSVNTTSASEAATTAVTVTATASSPVSGNQTVSLGVSGTGITAGDYTLSNTTITILSGQTTGLVTFTVVDDPDIEGLETATLTISGPSSGLVLGPTITQDVSITDNDVPAIPTVNLSVSTNSGSEAASTVVTVGANASAPVSGDQTVSVGVSGTNITAGDYTLSNATITIPNGGVFGSATFTVVDDAVVEGSETATLAINGLSAGLVPGVTTQNVTISDNDLSVDLARYVRVGRFDLPEPTRTAHPANSLLAQEASAVTYDWDTDTLFVVGDGGTSVVQVTKTGQLIDSMTLAPGSSPQGTDFYDTEGVTYVGGGTFALVEERYRQANLFTYAPGGTLHRTDVQTVKIGTTIGNIGLEGASYDPLTSGFVFVKEKDPQSIFQTGIDFNAGTATNGSAGATSSTDLFNAALANLADFSDVFALSNLPSLSGQDDYSHLLVISQESGQVVNIDRSGVVHSRLTIVADPGSPLTVPDMTMEGVTMDRDGYLYVVNENGGGDANHPQLWVYALSTATNLAPTGVTLINQVTSIPENTSTASAVKVADISIADDGLGNNNLSLTGPDASAFQTIGIALYLRAGTVLNHVIKPSYNVTVNVDDPAVGASPDATAGFTLGVTAPTGGTPSLIISEVAPWSSGNSTLAADWFEVTNIGTAAADITGWKMDDNSASSGSAVALNGITSIAPGESVIFIENGPSGRTPANDAAFFRTLWFGANPPPNLQIGNYGGSGIGLSATAAGDAVNLFSSSNVLQANVVFLGSPAGPFPTFDNAAGLNNATISTLSAVGINGAFAAINHSTEIGSPGTLGASATSVVTIAAFDANAAEAGNDPGTFRVTRTGSTVGALTVNYTIAAGVGQATSDDYAPALAGSATIASGESFVDVTIAPVNDLSVEGPETLALTLFDSGSYDVGAPATATVTIADNDFPSVNLSVSTNTASEAAATVVTVTATASPAVTGSQTVSLGVSGIGITAGDYTLSGATITIPDGQTTGSVIFTVVDDPSYEGTETATLTMSAPSSGLVLGVTTTADVTITDNDPAPACSLAPTHNIGAIQGAGNTAAITGSVRVRGVVVGDYEGASPALRGFFMQDLSPDGDPATSDGIFVFEASNANSVSLGQVVQVTGTAGENQGQTQIAASVVESCGTTASVAPVDVTLPVAAPVGGVPYLEQLEGMLVRFHQTLFVTEHFQLGRFGQVVMSSGGRLPQPTNVALPGAPAQAQQAANDLNRIIVDDEVQTQNPDPIEFGRGGNTLTATNTLRGGDSATDMVGVMTYNWAGNAASPNAYRLRPVGALGGGVPSFVAANPRPFGPPVVGGRLKVVGMNVLNYFLTLDTGQSSLICGPIGFKQQCRGAETATELGRQQTKLNQALVKLDADILGLMELENTQNAGGLDANPLADIVARLNGVVGPGVYDYIDTGIVGTDTIRVGFIYKPAKVTAVGGFLVDLNPVHNRPPIAQLFTENASGERLTVIANHFKSKGCDGAGGADLDQNDGQGCWNARRVQQAQALLSFIGGPVLSNASGDADVLLLGDFNAYAKEDPIRNLETGGFANLVSTFSGASAYSYAFDGQWGYLDQGLVSASLLPQVTGAGDYHINADEPNVLDYNTDFKTAGQVVSLFNGDEFRISDHDPVVVGLALDRTAPAILAHANVNAPATGPAGANVLYAPPNATDNVDPIAPAVCAPLPGSLFAIGTTLVTCNKTDAAGNVATPTSFNVVVSVGTPSVTAALVSKTANTATVRFTNTGTGNAKNFYVNTVSVTKLNGTGTIAFAGVCTTPACASVVALPTAAAGLSVGGTADVTFKVAITGSVTRYSIAEGLKFQSISGTNFTAAQSQAVVP